MSWYYRPSKRKCKLTGEVYWGVVEYYSSGYSTSELSTPRGSTKAELIRDLEMMLEDCKRRKTLDETKEK